LLTLPAPSRRNEDAFVFPNLANRQSGGAHGLSFTFKRIMKKARIQLEVVRRGTGEGRDVMNLSFHSLRHTFNSIMANKGVAQEIRQKLTGHASPEMNKAYTHHELEPLRAAIELLPSVR
jgi:integrase